MMKWINKKRNKKGFTLVELAVVIAILGILAAIAVPKLGSSRLTANVRTHNANVRILKSAAAMYLGDNPDVGDTADSGTINDNIAPYLDGDDLPKPYQGHEYTDKANDFAVSIKNGNIEVKPGELYIVDGEGGKSVTTEKPKDAETSK